MLENAFSSLSISLLHLFAAEQLDAYLVGGAVRDALLDRPIHDYDIATGAPWPKAKEICERAGARVIETGVQQGSITVLFGSDHFEITSFRTESSYSDARHPDAIRVASSIEEDVVRRDFTMNALAYKPERGLVDYVGGVSDIQKRLIKTVGIAKERFLEDPLRMLRALRFASELGFSIEDKTSEALYAHKERLLTVSKERVGQEMLKLLRGPYASKVLRTYSDMLNVLFVGDYNTLAKEIERANKSCAKSDVLWALFLKNCDVPAKEMGIEKTIQTGALALLSADSAFSDATFGCVAKALQKLPNQAFSQKLALYMDITNSPEKQCKSTALGAFMEKGLPVSPKDLSLDGQEAGVKTSLQGYALGLFLQTLHKHVLHLGYPLTKEELTTMAKTYAKNYQKVLSYLKGNKNEKNFIGLELERFVICEHNKPVYYNALPGLSDFFKRWLARFPNAKPITEKDALVGVSDTVLVSSKEMVGASLTLEPGSQLEMSIGPAKNSFQLYEALETLDVQFAEITEEMGVRWKLLAKGVNPYLKNPETAPLLPKARYQIMDAYFEDKGLYAKDMMRLSASTQVSLDLLEEQETELKLALALEPLLYAMTENAQIWRGEKACFTRQRIWDETDSERCEFDASMYRRPSIDAYATWLLSRSALFDLKNPDQAALPNTTLAEQMLDEPLDDEQIALIASSVFPPIRIKGLVEIRTADALPPKEAVGLSAFIETLFYNQKAQGLAAKALCLTKLSKEAVQAAKAELISKGRKGKAYGRPVDELIGELLLIAKEHVKPENKELLEAFIAYNEKAHQQ